VATASAYVGQRQRALGIAQQRHPIGEVHVLDEALERERCLGARRHAEQRRQQCRRQPS
jgi:hypothetical protein